MKKEPLIILIVMLVLIAATYVAYSFNSSQQKTATTVAAKTFDKKSFIYFYGETCPHCKELNEWIKKEGIDKKVKYQKLEVYYNDENAALMQEAGKVCKLNQTQGMGVPFVYDNGKCYLGVPEAQKIFRQKFDQATKK